MRYGPFEGDLAFIFFKIKKSLHSFFLFSLFSKMFLLVLSIFLSNIFISLCETTVSGRTRPPSAPRKRPICS